ncbi:hypothetical protein COOONC_02615 [Cooperia oncophora]
MHTVHAYCTRHNAMYHRPLKWKEGCQPCDDAPHESHGHDEVNIDVIQPKTSEENEQRSEKAKKKEESKGSAQMYTPGRSPASRSIDSTSLTIVIALTAFLSSR